MRVQPKRAPQFPFFNVSVQKSECTLNMTDGMAVRRKGHHGNNAL